jgi:hypothetical protein
MMHLLLEHPPQPLFNNLLERAVILSSVFPGPDQELVGSVDCDFHMGIIER